MRTETDSLGPLNIPQTDYYGIHTQRALHNFPIAAQVTHPELIRAFLEIKQAAAQTNATSGNLDRSVAKHIVRANPSNPNCFQLATSKVVLGHQPI